MPSIARMRESCERLRIELRGETVDTHRLLEIETTVRLLVPHLTRLLADASHAGKAPQLDGAVSQLIAMREYLGIVERGRSNATFTDGQETMRRAIECANGVLAELSQR